MLISNKLIFLSTKKKQKQKQKQKQKSTQQTEFTRVVFCSFSLDRLQAAELTGRAFVAVDVVVAAAAVVVVVGFNVSALLATAVAAGAARAAGNVFALNAASPGC